MSAILDNMPVVRIPADSEITVTLGGQWTGTSESGQAISGTVLCDATGAAVAQGSHSCFLSIFRKSDGVELVTQQPMTTWLNPPGCFSTVLAATVCLSGAGPWRRLIEVFDATGTGGTKYASFRADYVEADGPR